MSTKNTTIQPADFSVDNHGSICILTGLTEACREWIEANVGNDETQHWAGGQVVEPRYIGAIVEALINEGFQCTT